MKNILSYTSPISGKDIKDWIQYHLSNQTSHTKDAKRLITYLNVDDNGIYRIYFDTKRISPQESKRFKKPMIARVDKFY